MNQNRNGAIGALLDEYSKAIKELQIVIKNLTTAELITLVDPFTQNPECKSIQTILTHVVSSGFSYAIYIHELKEASPRIRQSIFRHTALEYTNDLNELLDFTAKTLSHFEDQELEAFQIKTAWGQNYDIEQLMEHAIIHVLRHRRQIEKFKQQLTTLTQ